MKEYQSTYLRNIAVVGHGKAGKTSLIEACLFDAGALKRLGKVDDGSSALDYDPEEVKRQMSISAALGACEWKGYKLNFIDTPGYPDFVGEVKGALRAADFALVVVSASAGVEVETDKVWHYAEEEELPRAIYINKMDRDHADFQKVLDELRVRFGKGVVPVQLPIGQANTFQGVGNLLTLRTKLVLHEEEVVKGKIPEFMAHEVDAARQSLIEMLAEYNNSLMEKYIEGEEISEEELTSALIEGILAKQLFPVFCGSATKNIGMPMLMNRLIEYMPSPSNRVQIGTDPKTGDLVERKCEDSFSAQVFKTIVDPFVGRLSFLRIFSGTMKGDQSYYNVNHEESERVGAIFTMQGKSQEKLSSAFAGDIVVLPKLSGSFTGDTLALKESPVLYEEIAQPKPMLAVAVRAKKKGDEDKVFAALNKALEEDPTLRMKKHAETKEMILKGIGEVQLEIIGEKLQRRNNVEMVTAEPRVAYRETIRKTVKAEGKHKKQSGGHGQYGHVWLEISPQAPGEGNAFTETIFGGSVPKQYIPAVEKGTAETLAGGILAGYPVVDIKVNLYDGSYHTVDSSEVAFKTATAQALKKGILDAHPVLLEPIHIATISAPEYYMGDIVGKLKSKRAQILGMEPGDKGMSTLKAQIPESGLYRYATELRSLTQGRGSYSLEFSHYEELPEKNAAAIIEQSKADRES